MHNHWTTKLGWYFCYYTKNRGTKGGKEKHVRSGEPVQNMIKFNIWVCTYIYSYSHKFIWKTTTNNFFFRHTSLNTQKTTSQQLWLQSSHRPGHISLFCLTTRDQSRYRQSLCRQPEPESEGTLCFTSTFLEGMGGGLLWVGLHWITAEFYFFKRKVFRRLKWGRQTLKFIISNK